MSAPKTKACPQCSFDCNTESQYCPECGFPVGAVAINTEDPMIGRVLPGGYQVVDLLGVGGMGRVYRAEQRALGRTVAVKVIHPHLSSDEKSLARFLTEARATSQLNHPNSVSVYDFGKTEDGQPYLVMEFLRGKNLAQVQASQGLLEWKRIVNVLKQVLLALGEAHELDIIHRDLKPENIVLEPMRRGGDFVKVVDFGLAKLKPHSPTPGITRPGIVCGTPDYMAPEQGRGDPIDGRSDLYAVGVVLFWLLTGRLPFENDSPTQVVMMHITLPAPDPREVAPQRPVPDAVAVVLRKALAKEPQERYQDAHEFADALEETLKLAPTPETQEEREFIECPHCRHRIPQARFCYECGERLPGKDARVSTQPYRRLPFTAREEELRWLHSLWLESAEKQVAVRIVGEPGVGKTRMMAEFLSRVQNEGGSSVIARPDPYWAEVSGYALRTLLRQLVSDEDLARLKESDNVVGPDSLLLVTLREILYNQAQKELNAERRKLCYPAALGWALELKAKESKKPLILFVDDLQRIDALTRQVLGDYVNSDNGGGVLVIATHVPGQSPKWSCETSRHLAGLPAHVATELLQKSSNKLGSIALAEVGNRGIPPLYVDQVLAFGLDGGSDPPARLADLIAHRLATLLPELRLLIQGLAVLGDEVPRKRLARIVQAEFVAEADIDRLVRTGFVERVAEGVFSLAHPLFHDIALMTTPAGVRKELHDRAGGIYRELKAPLEVLADHAAWAEDSMTALLLLEQAAESALSRGDEGTATFALKRGLDIAREEIYRGEIDDPMRAIAIFGRKLGATLNRRGKLSDAEGVLLEALDNTLPDSADRAEILELLAKVAEQRSRTDDARRYLELAIVAATEDGPKSAPLRNRLETKLSYLPARRESAQR